MGAILESRGLAVGYYGHAVATDIDIEVNPGEVVALLGPNGAGKTTALLTLAGVLPAVEGEVMFNGSPAEKTVFKRARSGMAFVTEERSVFMGLTTRENLKVGRCDIDRALAIFPELEPLMDRLGGQLSGGEQQILTLARALAREPQLLMADELSLGLAPKIVARLLAAARQAAAEDGIGVLLVEQHINQALKYADRAYALNRGQIVRSGSVGEVAPYLEGDYLTAREETA